MKFMLFELIVIAYFVSEIYCNLQIVQYSDRNDISISNHHDVSPPATIMAPNANFPIKTIRNNTIGTKKRKRKRRKKKIQSVNQSTTDISVPKIKVSVVEDNFLNINLTSTKRPRRRRLKTRRRSGRRRQNNTSIASSLTPNSTLEIRSLILPVMPTPKPTMINNTRRAKINKPDIKNSRCSKNNGGCSHLCLQKGLQKCQCFKGFRLAVDKKSCIDINECTTNTHDCQINCTNTIGSYRCYCPRGLRLSLDAKSCLDVNECLLRNGHGPCQDTCKNTYGGYKCNCNGLKGTKLGEDLHSCVDMDECSKDNGGCSHVCINTFGRSFCSCPEEMELSMDFKTCQDIDITVNT